jgi:hypothetical protein
MLVQTARLKLNPKLVSCDMIIFHVKIPFILQGVENTLAEERKSSPAVAHAFKQFELVHFPLDHAIVLGESESCNNSCFVPLNPCDKALEFADLTGFDSFKPSMCFL